MRFKMNKIIILLFIFIMGNFASFAQIHCPYGGKVDCRGECGLYTDNDGDGFCDYGKLSQESTPVRDTAINSIANTATKKTTTIHAETKKERPSPPDSLQQTENVAEQPKKQINQSNQEETQPLPSQKAPYHLFEISIVLILCYLMSVFFVKYRIYTLATHRKIWNIGLSVSFLISCLIGLLMAYYVNIQHFPTCYHALVLYHVEFGVAMTILALFHLIWHWHYYFNIFKSKRQKTGKPVND